MIRIPYGVSNFEQIRERGYHFVDRTAYIRKLEELDTLYLFFLRPRRFGKSLWVSILEHYYGLRRAGQFETLFGGLDIMGSELFALEEVGRHPRLTAAFS